MVGRTIVALASASTITSGGGNPGGTNVVIFVDRETNQLQAIYPDGSHWKLAYDKVADSTKFVPVV